MAVHLALDLVLEQASRFGQQALDNEHRAKHSTRPKRAQRVKGTFKRTRSTALSDNACRGALRRGWSSL